MLEKFAQELKAARESKGIPIYQIAAKTRLDQKFLEEMEKGNFSFLPELYVKAFIKEYSKMVGLNENITLKKFEAAKKGKAYDENGETEEDIQLKKQKLEKEQSARKKEAKPEFNATYNPSESSDTGSENKRIPKRSTIIWTSVIAVSAIIAIYFAFIKSNQDIIVTEKPYDVVKQNSTERYVEESPKPAVPDSIKNTSAASDSLVLEIDVTDTSWVKIMLDNSKVEEFTLFPHSRKEIKAAKLYQIIVGNSAVTHFSLDNKPLSFSGNKKEVKFITIDSTGLKYLTTPPNFGNQ